MLTLPSTPDRSAARREMAAQGYSLAELLVSMGVLVIVLVAILTLFDRSANIARVQTDLADTQQALRATQQEMIRKIRMAGRGGLPAALVPEGTFPGRPLPRRGRAIEVRNGQQGELVAGTDTTLETGSDVLIVRGVFGPMYLVNWSETTDFELDGEPLVYGGRLLLKRMTNAGVEQDLGSLAEVKSGKGIPIGDALIIASPIDPSVYAVVEISGIDTTEDSATIHFCIREDCTPGGKPVEYIRELSPEGDFPLGLESVAFAGILEEHRYYIRRESVIVGQEEPTVPILTRARLYPGTDHPYLGKEEELKLAISHNILDFQIALGIDRPGGVPGLILPGPDENGDQKPDRVDVADDDWLFNSPADIIDQENPTPEEIATWGFRPLHFIRLTTLARTARRDLGFLPPMPGAPLPGKEEAEGSWIEDRDYREIWNVDDPQTREKIAGYRTRVITTTVDVRNL
jgi:type II secretory pathway pseudopilin PulG